jgi:hypothetical protein
MNALSKNSRLGPPRWRSPVSPRRERLDTLAKDDPGPRWRDQSWEQFLGVSRRGSDVNQPIAGMYSQEGEQTDRLSSLSPTPVA